VINFLRSIATKLMTCTKPCDDCKCKPSPCGHLGYDDDIYIEIDDSSFAPRSLYKGLTKEDN